MQREIAYPHRSAASARTRLQQTLEEYCLLDTHLRDLEDTNFRVCLFGSARITTTDPLYHTVFELSRALAARGMDVITGGGPGLMEAANAGVRAALHGSSQSYGLTLDVPALDEAANPHLDIKSSHKRFSSRLDEFVRLSHGVVVAPGGIGTLLELMYVWQLLQVGMIERRPVVLLGALFWNGFLRWVAGAQASQGFLDARDLDYLLVADSIDEAVQVMAREQELYQRRQPLGENPPTVGGEPYSLTDRR
jgi:uncharacterized protein (TIGR00730 family)